MRYNFMWLVAATRAITTALAQRPFYENEYPFTIDFTGVPGGVNSLFTRIKSVYNDFVPQTGDLTTLTTASDDSFHVMFGGERLELERQSFSLQRGKFVFPSKQYDDETGSDRMYIEYKVQLFNLLSVEVQCGDLRSSLVPFILVENGTALPYKSYDLFPPANVQVLLDEVSLVCFGGEPLLPTDLSRIVFGTHRTAFIRLLGFRFELGLQKV
ncbi:hypothetical protein FOL47_008625 [Perkinsus chesapeaki]|uniref:Uncharacterized protein n=1 Tax=Perkinsus chesapeaki TaxID=330153 RepID=A0A7J6LCV4_PERCH|nr:hypothetical protein FOL47_008625 [Perkinsus chesapeaki]